MGQKKKKKKKKKKRRKEEQQTQVQTEYIKQICMHSALNLHPEICPTKVHDYFSYGTVNNNIYHGCF